MEITVWQSQGRPMPAAGISGGEWTMIVILTVVGASVWSAQRLRIASGPWDLVRFGGWDVMAEPTRFPVTAKEVAAGKTPKVLINNSRGSIRIQGVDGETVKLSGQQSVRALDSAAARRAANDAPVRMKVDNGVVTIEGSRERSDDITVAADLEIQVPKGAAVECRGRRSDFDVSDVAGLIDVEAERSTVRVLNSASPVRISLKRSDLVRVTDAKGDVEIRGGGSDVDLENIAGQVTINGSFSGETMVRNIAKPVRFESSVTTFRAEGIPGEVIITLGQLTGENLVGPVVVENRSSKDVKLSDVSNAVSVSLDRGDIDLRLTKTPLAKLDLRSRSGAVDLALPERAGFQLEAETERGEIVNDFSEKLKDIPVDGRGAKLAGTTGPGPEVRVSTNRGTIQLRKSMAGGPPPPRAPAPPAPPSAGVLERATKQ
jgi:DUF4097 and DUF4098 domain-containing protein YvlB